MGGSTTVRRLGGSSGGANASVAPAVACPGPHQGEVISCIAFYRIVWAHAGGASYLDTGKVASCAHSSHLVPRQPLRCSEHKLACSAEQPGLIFYLEGQLLWRLSLLPDEAGLVQAVAARVPGQQPVQLAPAHQHHLFCLCHTAEGKLTSQRHSWQITYRQGLRRSAYIGIISRHGRCANRNTLFGASCGILSRAIGTT